MPLMPDLKVRTWTYPQLQTVVSVAETTSGNVCVERVGPGDP